MKKNLPLLLLSITLISSAQASELERAKCAIQIKEQKFFILDENHHCRDLRNSCEYESKVYSLGSKINDGMQRCAIPEFSIHDALAKWIK